MNTLFHSNLTPRLKRTLTIAVLAFAVLFSLTKPISAIDLSVYLRMGEWMSTHRQLLEQEPYALAALGETFQNGTWLSQVLFYQLFRLGGYPALQVLLALITALTLVLVALHARARASLAQEGPAVLFAWLFLLQNLGIRPQAFSVLLFALTYYLLDVHPLKRSTPYLLVGIFALWACLHGAFPIAFALPAAFFFQSLPLGPRQRLPGDTLPTRHADVPPPRWVLLGAAMLLGSCLTPYGPSLYLYIFENSTMPATRGLEEWLPPRLDTFMGARFFVGLGVCTAVLWRSWPVVRRAELLLFLLYAVLAAQSQRMIVWWGLVTAPLLVGWWATRTLPQGQHTPPNTHLEPPPRLHVLLGRMLLGLWTLLLLASAPTRQYAAVDTRGDYEGLEKDTPVKVATYLLKSPGGRMFCRFEWSSYFLWRLWPAWQPYLDIRIWIFSDEIWRGYLDAGQGKNGWEQLMEQHQLDTLVLSPETQAGLIQAATAHASWHEVYRDEQAVVFRKQGSGEM